MLVLSESYQKYKNEAVSYQLTANERSHECVCGVGANLSSGVKDT
jgi:hypothetical protein